MTPLTEPGMVRAAELKYWEVVGFDRVPVCPAT
jgi:hypothetical protein